jgi:hypothetical protein
MHQSFKKYIASFFLFLFLVPTIEKELHAFEHKDDLHCTSNDKHFHEQEHTCSVCDFNCSSSSSIPVSEVQFILSSKQFSFNSFSENVYIVKTFSSLPARAPPIAS